MQLSENWFVDAPWAQLLCSTKIPDDTLQRFIAMSDKVLDVADGLGNTSVIPSSWEISPEKFQEHDVLSYTMEMVSKYMNTMLSNGNVKQNMDNVISDGPHTQWNSRIITAWIVSQKEDDYLPVHAHNQVTADHQFAKISGVMYLKLPKQMERKLDETSLKTGKDGQIAFTGMGDADPLQTTSLYNIQPEIGWFYIFPSTLNHQVYPFKGEGERRGISFNVDFMSKEQLEKLQKLQG